MTDLIPVPRDLLEKLATTDGTLRDLIAAHDACGGAPAHSDTRATEAEIVERCARIADEEADVAGDDDWEAGDYWIATHIARRIRATLTKGDDHDAGE